MRDLSSVEMNLVAGGAFLGSEQGFDAASSLGQLIETGVWGRSFLSDLLTAYNYGMLSAQLLQTTIAVGCNDLQAYRLTDGLHNVQQQGSLINWGQVDWSRYDNGGTCESVMENLFNAVQSSGQ